MHKDCMDYVFRDFMKEKYGGIDVLVNNAAIAFKQVKYYFPYFYAFQLFKYCCTGGLPINMGIK